jgi:hypothetical protein
MKVLTISVDVSTLNDQEIEDLQVAMEVQTDDYIGTHILTAEVTEQEEEQDEPDLH